MNAAAGARRLVAHPLAVVVLAAVTVALALPSVSGGFCTDDHAFRALLRAGRSPLDLFAFALGDPAQNQRLVAHGLLPWWAAPDLQIHFLRPLTGALFALDMRLFGDQPVGYHLDSVACYVALVVAVAFLYRRVLGPETGFVAALVFVLAGCHASAYAWVSARHVLLGAGPVAAALVLHVRGRQQGKTWLAWAAPALLALGLAASEAALAGAAYFFAYEVFARRGDSLRLRIASLAKPAAVLLSYVVVYRFVGCGVRGSAAYHDPMKSPVRVAGLALLRAPALAADGLLDLPSEGALLGGRALAFLVVAGVVGCALFARLFFASRKVMETREVTALSWLVPGAIASLVLVAGTGIPGGRLLVVPDIGLAALVGVVLSAAIRRSGEVSVSAVARGACVLVAALHLVLGPLLALREMRSLAARGRQAEAMAADVEAETQDARSAFVIASDPLAAVYAKAVRADVSERRLCWSALAAARTRYRLTRTGERSLSLEALDRPLVTAFFETLFRADGRSFAVGDEVEQCGAQIRVAAVQDGRPTRLDLELRRSPHAVAFVAWEDGHLARVRLPDVGGVDLPWEPGPTERRAGL